MPRKISETDHLLQFMAAADIAQLMRVRDLVDFALLTKGATVPAPPRKRKPKAQADLPLEVAK